MHKRIEGPLAGLLLLILAVEGMAAVRVLSPERRSSMGTVNLAETAARGAHDGPISTFDLQRLEFDRGQLWLEAIEPIVLQLQQPANAVGLQVGALHDAVVLVTLHRGDHLAGRQLFADRAVPGSRVAVVRDGWMGVESDQAFDRVELSRIEGAGPAVGIEELSLSTDADAGARGAGGELACILPLAAAYNFSSVYTLTPAPGSYAAGWAAYAANLALKFCKPTLIAPGNVERQVPPGQCEIELEQPHMAFLYSDALGIPIATQSDWGELGTPQMLHHNTDVDVMLLAGNPGPPTAKSTELDFLLTSASFDASDKIWESCRDDGSVRYSQLDGAGPEYECPYVEDRTLSFPVGHNTVVWRANPRLSPVDLVIPFPGLPSGAKFQPYSGLLFEIWLETWFTVLDTQINGWRLPNAQFDFQSVTVFDEIPPTITPSPGSEGNASATLVGGVLHVTIEADEVGGVSRRRYEDILRSFLDVTDACDRPTMLNVDFPTEALRSFWPVSTDTQDNSFEVTWTARDPGPNLAGDPNETIASMWIEVLDRQPPSLVPPPDIVEIDTQQVSDLGQPAVFDLVDLSPQVSNDADLPLGLGLHEVTWTAVDAAGNSSQAVQVVNIKASNVPPVALAQTGAGRPDAISFEPTPIRLQGNDPDGDPLRFQIEDVPENGFFVAPLHPYFIEDFRMEESASDAELEALCLPDPTGNYQLEFPSDPSFFTVNDRGDTFVADMGSIECRSPPTVFLRQHRLARFNPDGTLNATQTNLGFWDIQNVDFDFSSGLVVTTRTSGSTGQGLIAVYDTDLNEVRAFSLTNVEDTSGDCVPFAVDGCYISYAQSAVADGRGLLYVMDYTGRIFALEDEWDPFDPATVFVDYLSDDVEDDPATWVNAEALAVDSEGFVYASRNDRIYKYEPARAISPSRVVPGGFIGWLGRCDVDLAPGDQAVCDVGNHRSLGFSCSDDICGVDDAFNAGEQALCDGSVVQDARKGCRPGQFRGTPKGLDIDSDGTIYVADSGNERIQRFTPDGFFAGQAKSTGSGSGFVIGDFGSPQNVSVNSSHFYVLDPSTNLLHISLLTPFVEIGDDYADLVYQSNNDFACENSADCIDAFSFRVSDGVRDPATGQPEASAPAQVEVEVSRNFREPFATPGIGAMVIEDVPEAITLDGSDPDPLDTLVFEVVDSPAHGAVSISGNQATYMPDADYWGPDAFSFSVSDGIDTSSPEVVVLEVAEINDAPIIDLPDEALDAGTGYRFELDLSFSDPDPDELHTVVIDWGDGTVAPEGEFDANGQPTGPILGHGGTGSGRITADHIFMSSGTKNVEICITDRMQLDGNDDKVPTPGLSLETCETIAVAVTDAVDLQLTAEPSADVALPGGFVSYVFDIENLAPQAGTGLPATGVAFSIILSRGFDPGSITPPPGCTRNAYRLDCTIGALSPGQSHDLNVTAQVDGDTESGYLLVTEAEAMLDQQPLRSDLLLLLTTPVSRPADFQVGAVGDALRDEPDANPGDGQCATVDGVCTLRAAIEEAAEAATPRVIALANGLYVLDDILEISSDVTLIGNGPDQTRIHGARVFTRTGADTLRIENLTLSGGGMTVGPDSLTIRRVRFTDNENSGSFGGAIQTTGSVLDIRDSTFDNNRAVDGGSLMCFDCSGVIENVTVTGGSGGGLTFANSGQVALKHLTIVGTGGGAFWSSPNGAALHVYNDMDVTISNSVVAGNYSTGTANNCAVGSTASLTSLGNNAFGDLTGCDISPLASDLSITNARLRPLAAGLDGLPVRLPKADSPLVDAFDDASCLATDARGLSRPRDGNDDGIAHCDIGAVERRADRLFSDDFSLGL